MDYSGVAAAGRVSSGGGGKKKSPGVVLDTMRSRLTMAIAAYSESREDELDDLRFFAGSPDNRRTGDPWLSAGADDQRPPLPDH